MSDTRENLSLAGAGTVTTGEYGRVSVSGSCKIKGDISCESFSASGSCGGTGNIKCDGDFKCSGAMHLTGEVICGGEFKVSGASSFDGDIEAHIIKIAGAVKGRSFRADIIKLAGAIGANGDVEAEEAHISGGGDITGLLNAEKIDIRFNGNNNRLKVGSIGGSEIVVDHDSSVNSEIRIFGIPIYSKKSSGGKLIAGTIEGDSITLNVTEADVVRGKNIIIGKGCKIGRVEYTDTYECDESSAVAEAVKL